MSEGNLGLNDSRLEVFGVFAGRLVVLTTGLTARSALLGRGLFGRNGSLVGLAVDG